MDIIQIISRTRIQIANQDPIVSGFNAYPFR